MIVVEPAKTVGLAQGAAALVIWWFDPVFWVLHRPRMGTAVLRQSVPVNQWTASTPNSLCASQQCAASLCLHKLMIVSLHQQVTAVVSAFACVSLCLW